MQVDFEKAENYVDDKLRNHGGQISINIAFKLKISGNYFSYI